MTVKNCQPILDDRQVRRAFSRLREAVSVGESTQMKQWHKIDGFFDDQNELAVAFDTTNMVHRIIIEDRRRGSRSSFQTNLPRPGSRRGEGLFVEDVEGKRYLTHSGVFVLGTQHPTFGQGNREIKRAFLEHCAQENSDNDRLIVVNGERRYLIAPVDEKTDVVFEHMRRALDDVTAFKNKVIETTNEANAGYPPSSERRYSIDTILEDGSFLERTELERLLVRLETKKNLILQGPPGTGKTWLAKRLAYALIGKRDTDRITVVQFHPSLSYEDFVCGWRPTTDVLRLADGVFLRAVQAAIDVPSLPLIVVIEEINRGNPAQIFGELITLLEADKRTEAEAVELAYTEDGNPRHVYVPGNLYVIGTMNIADRSLALVDYALRRRFAFATLAPNLGARWREWMTSELGIDTERVAVIERRITALNESIANDNTLGDQFRIGHSYVTPTHGVEPDDAEDWYTDVVNTEIVPLLEEYWFEDAERVEQERAKLLADW